MDLIVAWEIPSEQRFGLFTLTDLLIGPQHGALNAVISRAEQGIGAQVRTMYAETTRERDALLESIRTSHWNANHDPVRIHVEAPCQVSHDFGNG